MTQQDAELLAAYGTNISYTTAHKPLKLHSNDAWVVEFRDIADLVAAAAAVTQSLCGRDDGEELSEEFIYSMSRLRIDALGQGYIAY